MIKKALASILFFASLTSVSNAGGMISESGMLLCGGSVAFTYSGSGHRFNSSLRQTCAEAKRDAINKCKYATNAYSSACVNNVSSCITEPCNRRRNRPRVRVPSRRRNVPIVTNRRVPVIVTSSPQLRVEYVGRTYGWGGYKYESPGHRSCAEAQQQAINNCKYSEGARGAVACGENAVCIKLEY